MTNSLSLRQCHLPGQSSFLFSKCFSRFPQSLKDQKDTFFIPAHGITIPQYPHIEIPVFLLQAITFWLDSGGLAPQASRHRLTHARPRATPTNPHVKYKCVPILILRLSFSPLNSVQIQRKSVSYLIYRTWKDLPEVLREEKITLLRKMTLSER